MKNPKLYLFNMRGYPLNHEKFINSVNHVAFTLNTNQTLEICCLEEMVFGKNAYYRNLLMAQLPGWEMITPKFYLPDINWRSAISVILVKKDLYKYKILEIPSISDRPDLDYGNLYNYVSLERESDKKTVRLLNVHCVNRWHNENLPKEYVMGRLELAEHFWLSINQEIMNNTEDIIVTGDFNAETGDPNYDLLNKSVWDSFALRQRWKYTYVSPKRGKHRYDHVLNNYHRGLSIIDPTPLVEKISDHTGLFYYDK